jgi:hypothetical protein
MNKSVEHWEHRLQSLSRELPYPPTPDIARAVRLKISERRPSLTRWRFALVSVAIVLVVLAGLMAVPGVRAAVLEFLQIGGIRILLPSATQTPTPAHTPLPSQTLPPTATPADLIALDDLAGETTLEEASQQVSFEVRLPSYPPDLGMPERVFIQDLQGDVLILVWTEEQDPGKARLILYEIAPGSWAGTKGEPDLVERTWVNDQPAVWVEGPHPFTLSDGYQSFYRLIVGRALIWAEDQVTYRLESYLSLEEAIKIAESLEALP